MNIGASTPRRKVDWSATLAFFIFIAPMAIGLIVFTYIPMVWGLLLSFSRARATIALGDWVGFQNYATLLGDDTFQGALITAVIFAVFIVPLTFFISLGLALLVNRATRGRSFFRTVFFVPTAVSYVVAALVWKMNIFSALPSGLANVIIYLFGVNPIAWTVTASPAWYWVVLVTVRLWLQIGFNMIIFLAGLQEIPQTLYEAAYVDGARPGSWATFRNITFPMLRNTSIAILLLLFIAAIQAFAEFYNILGTGGSALVNTPLTYLYNVALAQQNYGVGTAGAFVLTFIIIIFTVLQGRILGFGRASD